MLLSPSERGGDTTSSMVCGPDYSKYRVDKCSTCYTQSLFAEGMNCMFHVRYSRRPKCTPISQFAAQ